MDKRELNLEMDKYAISGVWLSTEEQLILRTSLPLLKISNFFEVVRFWGKVFGDENDYYIAQGFSKDFIRNKQTFYSLDGHFWRLLYPPLHTNVDKLHFLRNRFKGIPDECHAYVETNWEYDGPDAQAYMIEQERLSALVKIVDIEGAIIPNGSFFLDRHSLVKPNPEFRGLSAVDAVKLNSYVHFRLPESDTVLYPREDMCPPGASRATNFLEPINKDIPKGCWTLHADEAIENVTLRNLWYPGITFYHRPNTCEFGSIYMGYGERNDDLPFML